MKTTIWVGAVVFASIVVFVCAQTGKTVKFLAGKLIYISFKQKIILPFHLYKFQIINLFPNNVSFSLT